MALPFPSWIKSERSDQINAAMPDRRRPAATAADRAHAALRARIVSGALPPGARLTVAALAAELGLSPMPVRGALLRLEGEGLVEADPHRGARVRRLDATAIRNLYRLRAAVLALLLPDVARHAGDADLDGLEAIESRFEAAAATGDAPAAMAANHEFHRRMLALARNPDAAAVMERSWALVEALRLRLGFGPGRLGRAVESHRALLAALRRRDAARATALAVASSDNAMADLLRLALAAPEPAAGRRAGRSGRA
jgi:DNA-binding GntR family transcriptional regulator